MRKINYIDHFYILLVVALYGSSPTYPLFPDSGVAAGGNNLYGPVIFICNSNSHTSRIVWSKCLQLYVFITFQSSRKKTCSIDLFFSSLMI